METSSLDELVEALDRINETWVETMAPTLSPRRTIERAARCTGDHTLVDAVLALRAAIVGDLPPA